MTLPSGGLAVHCEDSGGDHLEGVDYLHALLGVDGTFVVVVIWPRSDSCVRSWGTVPCFCDRAADWTHPRGSPGRAVLGPAEGVRLTYTMRATTDRRLRTDRRTLRAGRHRTDACRSMHE
jgi:hypothetical protein